MDTANLPKVDPILKLRKTAPRKRGLDCPFRSSVSPSVISGDLSTRGGRVLAGTKLKALTSKQIVEALPANTHLLVSLKLPTPHSPDKVKQDYLDHVRKTYGIPKYHDLEVFADLITREPLKIHLRDTKDATLEPCRCEVEFLGRDARSVNHAYSLLSAEFETQRISNTGNVFHKIFFQQEDGSWNPLDHLRRNLEARQESELFINDRIRAGK